MTNRAIRVLLAVSMFAPAAVMAGPSYNYIEAGYQSVDLDDGPTLDGYGLGGSFAVADNFHVFGSIGAVYHFTHNFGLSGGVDASSDATGWNLGVRFSF